MLKLLMGVLDFRHDYSASGTSTGLLRNRGGRGHRPRSRMAGAWITSGAITTETFGAITANAGPLAGQSFESTAEAQRALQGGFQAPAPSPTSTSTPIVGRASVIDGDTLEIHGQRIRLHGIDAPESAQICRNGNGSKYLCGQLAALALSDKIGQRTVSCKPRDVDRYHRIIAVCRAGVEDLNGWLVSQGWAVAYRRFSMDYVSAENAARSAKLGI